MLVAGLHQRGELARDLLLLCVELADLGSIAAQDPDAQRGRRLEPPPADHAPKRGQPGAHLLRVGQPLDHLQRQLAEQRVCL